MTPVTAHWHWLPLRRSEDFQQASDAVLELLQSRFPMGLWMVTRTVEDDWVVLQASDRSYGVTGGDHFRWSDSFCYRMVRGEGPNVAADSSSVPAYAQAPIGRDIPSPRTSATHCWPMGNCSAHCARSIRRFGPTDQTTNL